LASGLDQDCLKRLVLQVNAGGCNQYMKELTERDICNETQAQKGMGPPYIRINREGTLGVGPEKTHPMTGK